MAERSSVASAGVHVGDYVLSHQIGSGSFAVVWKAQHCSTGESVAVKEINVAKLNRKLKQSLEGEVSILRRISHENIVKLHQVIEDGNRLYLVMEYCAGGDLAGYIRRCKRVPETTARHLLRQLAAGLREMWSHHLVHRDLKPQNLLLSDSSPTAVLKIADFGFARALQPHNLAETLCGSPLYMAPEILQFHKYDSKADLWSVGAILYELVVGRPPFTGANHVQLLRAIERTEAKIPAAMDAVLSAACRSLILSLLKRTPVERIAFEEFFSHPFLDPVVTTGTSQQPPTAPTSLLSAQARGADTGTVAATRAEKVTGFLQMQLPAGNGATPLQHFEESLGVAGDGRPGDNRLDRQLEPPLEPLQGFPFVVDNHLARQPLPAIAITGPPASQVPPLGTLRRPQDADAIMQPSTAAGQHLHTDSSRFGETQGKQQVQCGCGTVKGLEWAPFPSHHTAAVSLRDGTGGHVADSIEDDYVLVDKCPFLVGSRGPGGASGTAAAPGSRTAPAGSRDLCAQQAGRRGDDACNALRYASPVDLKSCTDGGCNNHDGNLAVCRSAANSVTGTVADVALGSAQHSQGLGAFDDDPFLDDALPSAPCVFPLQPTEQEVMWEVARTLDYLAYCQQENGRPEESLALQLLSLDLLLALLHSAQQPAPGNTALRLSVRSPQPTAAGPVGSALLGACLGANAPVGAVGPSGMGVGINGNKNGAAATSTKLPARADAGLTVVAQAASKVAANAEAATERLTESGQWSGGLPDVVNVMYSCARHMGRGGAVEELLGNYAGALHAYAKAGTLLYFLCTDLALFEAGAPLHLQDSERAVVHRLVLHTSTRYLACKQALDAAAVKT